MFDQNIQLQSQLGELRLQQLYQEAETRRQLKQALNQERPSLLARLGLKRPQKNAQALRA